MRLIMLRHGHAAGDALTTFGRTQIQNLSERLKDECKDLRCHVLTSPSGRAYESAQMIAEAVGTVPVAHSAIGDLLPQDYDSRAEGVNMLVSGYMDKTDVLILVTHAPIVSRFPQDLARARKYTSFPPMVDQGKALSIELDTGEMKII